MANKKSTITSILCGNVKATFAASYFRIGDTPLNNAGDTIEAMNVVKSIKHSRHAFGQGAQVDQPCYIVEFVDGAEKLIIPVLQPNSFVQVTVSVIDNNEEPTPAMPEN